MVFSANNLLPRVIALAVVGYCVWPSVSELTSETATKRVEPVQELAASLLSPTMPPFPTRDPFGGAALAIQDTPSDLAKKTDLASKGESGKSPPSVPGKPGDPGAKKTEPPANPLAGLTLDATCIVGDRRLAIISGQLYAAQETLTGPSSAPPLKIVKVFPYKVVLEREGKTIELTYSNTRHPSEAGAQAAAETASDAADTSSKKKKTRTASANTETKNTSRLSDTSK